MSRCMQQDDFRHGWAKTLLLAGMAVVVVSGLGVAAGHLMVRSSPGAGANAESNEKKQGQDEGKTVYVDFGSVVVNLSEGRLTRYLKVSISMQVKSKWKSPLKKMMDSGKQSLFKNWLITYLSDLKLEDVKGSESIEKLRDGICEGFNRILKKHGEIRIEKVLFKEFKVQ